MAIDIDQRTILRWRARRRGGGAYGNAPVRPEARSRRRTTKREVDPRVKLTYSMQRRPPRRSEPFHRPIIRVVVSGGALSFHIEGRVFVLRKVRTGEVAGASMP